MTTDTKKVTTVINGNVHSITIETKEKSIHERVAEAYASSTQNTVNSYLNRLYPHQVRVLDNTSPYRMSDWDIDSYERHIALQDMDNDMRRGYPGGWGMDHGNGDQTASFIIDHNRHPYFHNIAMIEEMENCS